MDKVTLGVTKHFFWLVSKMTNRHFLFYFTFQFNGFFYSNHSSVHLLKIKFFYFVLYWMQEFLSLK